MKEGLLHSVRHLRMDIREKVKDEVLSEYNEARKGGKYPWEGMWLNPEQISMVQQRLKKKDKVIFFELMVFFSLLFLVILPMFYSITVSIMPGQNGEELRKIFKGAAQQSPASPDLKGTGLKSSKDSKMNKGREAARQELSRVSRDTNRSDHFIENQSGKVNANMLKLREGPGIRYPVISRLRYGESITVQDKNGVWLKVMTGNSLLGWVSGEYIKLTDLSGRKDLTSNHDDGRKSPVVLSTAEKSGGSLKSETPVTSGEKVSQKDAGRDNKYYVQVGAWKKFSYAQEVVEKVKARYPDVFIEYRNSMYKVKIPGILDKEQGSLILKEIRENFNFAPLLMKKQ